MIAPHLAQQRTKATFAKPVDSQQQQKPAQGHGIVDPIQVRQQRLILAAISVKDRDRAAGNGVHGDLCQFDRGAQAGCRQQHHSCRLQQVSLHHPVGFADNFQSVIVEMSREFRRGEVVAVFRKNSAVQGRLVDQRAKSGKLISVGSRRHKQEIGLAFVQRRKRTGGRLGRASDDVVGPERRPFFLGPLDDDAICDPHGAPPCGRAVSAAGRPEMHRNASVAGGIEKGGAAFGKIACQTGEGLVPFPTLTGAAPGRRSLDHHDLQVEIAELIEIFRLAQPDRLGQPGKPFEAALRADKADARRVVALGSKTLSSRLRLGLPFGGGDRRQHRCPIATRLEMALQRSHLRGTGMAGEGDHLFRCFGEEAANKPLSLAAIAGLQARRAPARLAAPVDRGFEHSCRTQSCRVRPSSDAKRDSIGRRGKIPDGGGSRIAGIGSRAGWKDFDRFRQVHHDGAGGEIGVDHALARIQKPDRYLRPAKRATSTFRFDGLKQKANFQDIARRHRKDHRCLSVIALIRNGWVHESVRSRIGPIYHRRLAPATTCDQPEDEKPGIQRFPATDLSGPRGGVQAGLVTEAFPCAPD